MEGLARRSGSVQPEGLICRNAGGEPKGGCESGEREHPKSRDRGWPRTTRRVSSVVGSRKSEVGMKKTT